MVEPPAAMGGRRSIMRFLRAPTASSFANGDSPRSRFRTGETRLGIDARPGQAGPVPPSPQ